MAHLFTDRFPNLFLWVQVWAGGWKEKDLQTRMLFQDFVNLLAPMPGSPIPKQEKQVAEPLTLYGNSSAVYQIAFSPENKSIASVGRDPVVHIYELNIEELVAIAKSRLTRTWTLEEYQKYLHTDICPFQP